MTQPTQREAFEEWYEDWQPPCCGCKPDAEEAWQAATAHLDQLLSSEEAKDDLRGVTALIIAGQTRAMVTSNGFAVFGDKIIDCNEIVEAALQAIRERMKA